jgi:hypothetical protein
MKREQAVHVRAFSLAESDNYATGNDLALATSAAARNGAALDGGGE